MYKKEQKKILGDSFRRIKNMIYKEKDKDKRTFLIGVLTGIDLLDDRLCVDYNASCSLNRKDLGKFQEELGFKLRIS